MILIKLRKSDVEKGKVDKKNYDTNDGHWDYVVYPYKCAKREVKEASSLDVVFILGL